jgi:predicted neuraminidase
MLSREILPVEAAGRSRHASTILMLPGGEILAAYFSGAGEAEPDVDIYLTRRVRGEGWSPPRRVSEETGIAHWNPVLAANRDGRILLFYKLGESISSWRTMVRESTDGGTNWDKARELVPGDRGGRGPVRNKPIALRDGAWLAGASLEREGRWTCFVDRSMDEGRTWTRSADIAIAGLERGGSGTAHPRGRPPAAISGQSLAGRGLIQPSLWEDEAGGAHALMRSSEGFVYRSDSDDGGASWCEPYPTTLPNNNSAIDLCRLENGLLVLAHNPSGRDWGPRTPLVLSTSKDSGGTWTQELRLDGGPGEYSYPAIIATPEAVLVSWTRNRKEFALARIEIREEPIGH